MNNFFCVINIKMNELDYISDSLLDIKNQISEIQNDITDIQLVEKRKKECKLFKSVKIYYDWILGCRFPY